MKATWGWPLWILAHNPSQPLVGSLKRACHKVSGVWVGGTVYRLLWLQSIIKYTYGSGAAPLRAAWCLYSIDRQTLPHILFMASSMPLTYNPVNCAYPKHPRPIAMYGMGYNTGLIILETCITLMSTQQEAYIAWGAATVLSLLQHETRLTTASLPIFSPYLPLFPFIANNHFVNV